jgi:hypothetical protein
MGPLVSWAYVSHPPHLCYGPGLDDEEPGKRVQTAEGMRDDHSSCFLALALVIWRTALLDLIHAGMHASQDPICTACCNMDYVHLALASLLLIQ